MIVTASSVKGRDKKVVIDRIFFNLLGSKKILNCLSNSQEENKATLAMLSN